MHNKWFYFLCVFSREQFVETVKDELLVPQEHTTRLIAPQMALCPYDNRLTSCSLWTIRKDLEFRQNLTLVCVDLMLMLHDGGYDSLGSLSAYGRQGLYLPDDTE